MQKDAYKFTAGAVAGVKHMRMDLETRKASIIDMTMKVASEVGLDVMTVNQVAKKAGISEALIFKYFISKDQLLKECYYTVAQQLIDFANQFDILEEFSLTEARDYMHDLWEKSFNYCVELDYRILYFLRFRETKLFLSMEEESREFFREGMMKYLDLFRIMDNMFQMDWEETGRLSMLFGLGISGLFLKRIIAHSIENTQEVRDMIWRLQWYGLSGGVA